ncbi:DUF6671 family protein [Flavobacterium sp.]|uniref:DUF6671 family protein n=1 Tax=Flavobacterium sp. TaxID=239 RepID=UPI0025DC9756|nr:DUF6671 family protein [Flavobacterium sp.]
MFEGRNLLIATKHRKETVIAPLFSDAFGVHCFTSDVIDTDSLGTFSGEIARKKNIIETLRDKCELAVKAIGADLVVASEGSFGAHPSVFFAHADDEWIMLKDYANDLEIIAREISTDTNFQGEAIPNKAALKVFAEKAKFPSHGIILKPAEDNYSKVIKGCQNWDELSLHFERLKNNFGTAYAETDMRAMHNPTRMKVIAAVTQKLIAKIKSTCPSCAYPGFDVTEVKAGLPCENCSFPTRSTLSHIYQCKNCAHTEEKLYPRHLQYEDPMYCDNCNP